MFCCSFFYINFGIKISLLPIFIFLTMPQNGLEWTNVGIFLFPILLTFYKLSEQKPPLFSAFFGFFCQFPIEIFDGFSFGYGFSVFDLLANFAGASFAYFQFIIWKRQIIFPQFICCSTSRIIRFYNS
ncbi:MAG: hypothetical protein EAZ53_16970 [Bacteroidetes bacterium]|nr:MAG: hypothetical protein EAZ53_16970 [Bacteroidota bacterium]